MAEVAKREEIGMYCRSGMLRGVVPWFFLVGLLWGWQASTSEAQPTDRLASKHYSRGMQYFHQGRYGEAQQEFDLATGYAPKDARIYFMRGLSKMRMGASYDAEADFQIGASVEVEYGRGDVGVALQRFQGSDRLLIERYRREAKKMSQSLAAAAKASDQANAPPTNSGSDIAPHAESPKGSDVATSPTPAAPKRQPATRRIGQLQPDETDPFASSAIGFLGRGENASPRVRQAINVDDATSEGSDDNALSDDDPVGSGVSPDAASVDEDAMSEDSDTASDADARESQPRTSTAGAAGSGKRGILGAALRAMMRAIPGESLTRQGQQLMPPIPGISGGQGGAMPPDAPMGNAATPDAANTPPSEAAESEQESFADPDPFEGEAEDEAPAKNDDNDATDTSDPFADEPQ